MPPVGKRWLRCDGGRSASGNTAFRRLFSFFSPSPLRPTAGNCAREKSSASREIFLVVSSGFSGGRKRDESHTCRRLLRCEKRRHGYAKKRQSGWLVNENIIPESTERREKDGGEKKHANLLPACYRGTRNNRRELHPDVRRISPFRASPTSDILFLRAARYNAGRGGERSDANPRSTLTRSRANTRNDITFWSLPCSVSKIVSVSPRGE